MRYVFCPRRAAPEKKKNFFLASAGRVRGVPDALARALRHFKNPRAIFTAGNFSI